MPPNHVPFYARLLMMQDSRFVDGFFEIRESRQRKRFAA